MTASQAPYLQRRLEQVLIAFFVVVTLSLLVVLAVDPAVYAQVLSLEPAASSFPMLVTLFLVGLLAFLITLIIGARRHWRWVFWIVLVAFSASILDILVTPLQLLGALPNLFPVWYSLYRLGIACAQVAIAAWMWRIYRQHGVWASGRKRTSRQKVF